MTEKADSKNLGHHFYDSRELPPPTYIDAANRGALASNATPYPPQPHHTQAICRTMHFMYGKWGANCVSVLADDRTTELYTMKLRMRKPNLTVESAFTHDTIGSVNYKMMKASMDSFVRGNPIPLTAHGILCAKYTWASPSLGGEGMTWNIKKSSFNLECLDGSGIPIARFRFSCWSWRKAGKFEFLGPKANNEATVEEVLVTGLALVECILMSRYAAAV